MLTKLLFGMSLLIVPATAHPPVTTYTSSNDFAAASRDSSVIEDFETRAPAQRESALTIHNHWRDLSGN